MRIFLLENRFIGIKIDLRTSAAGQTLSLVVKVIRSKERGLFLTNNGGWTDDFLRAQKFEDLAEARNVKSRLGLQQVELLFCSSEDGQPSQWDYTLPLP